MNHSNETHAILAPDTAMLKPGCDCPFDIPLMSGLNFLRISDVNKIGEITAEGKIATFVTVQHCHLAVLMCIDRWGRN